MAQVRFPATIEQLNEALFGPPDDPDLYASAIRVGESLLPGFEEQMILAAREVMGALPASLVIYSDDEAHALLGFISARAKTRLSIRT